MLTEKQLDQFLDEFWEDSQSAQTEAEQEISEENLEEYALPADGMIIRQMERKGKVSRRTWFALVLMLLVVPLLLYLSVRYFHGRKYLICSLIVIIAAMIPFFMMFEGRKPKAREIMVISVLAAIGVAGRAAFFMVPSFKPVAAIVILTGISFGGEAGPGISIVRATAEACDLSVSQNVAGRAPRCPEGQISFHRTSRSVWSQ